MLSTQQALIHRRDRRTNPRQIVSRQTGRGAANPLRHDASRSGSATADAALEFGSFRVLLGRRQLFADLRRYGDVDRQCPPPGTPTLLIKVDIPNPDGALQSGGLLHCRVKHLAQIAGADRACLDDDL
jgi:hypothetical protein